MKKVLFCSISILSLLISCGPAAEDREKMHVRAKVFQDSIAAFIRESMAEAETPASGPVHDHSGLRPCPVCGVVTDTVALRKAVQNGTPIPMPAQAPQSGDTRTK